jgi:ClpP class serine protease
MNQQFRTISALLRSPWAIEEGYALAHEPLLNAYLSGKYSEAVAGQTETDESKLPFATTAVEYLAWRADATTLVNRYALDDPNLPEDSVLIIPVQGPMFKYGFCGSLGALDYANLIEKGYATQNIIGMVAELDCPGGQVAGISTLFGAVKDDRKPFVTVVNEGVMASAAFWGFCPSDFIFAAQKTDQIGSIGVFMRLRDSSEAEAKAGVRTFTVYSDRSAQKNKPTRDLLEKGDDTALKAELNQTADLFHEAVKEGRGERLKNGKKGSEDDVFEGAMFSAEKAIQLGLIDGFGGIKEAVAKVVELHNARKSGAAGTAQNATSVQNPQNSSAQLPAPTVATSEVETNTPGANSEQAPTQATTNNQTQDEMFGDKHKALTALAGVEASAITDDQLNSVNANLDTLDIKGVRLISTAYLQDAEKATAQAATLNTTIATLTKERDDAKAEAAKFGSQPGHIGTKSEKTEEPTAGQEKNTVISQTTADLLAMRKELGLPV